MTRSAHLPRPDNGRTPAGTEAVRIHLCVRGVSEFEASCTAVSGHRSHLSQGCTKGMPRLVVTAGLVEGRTTSGVARDYGVSRRSVVALVQRFLAEGDPGLQPRSRRPRPEPDPGPVR